MIGKYIICFGLEDEDMTETTPDGTIQSYESSSPTANGLVHSLLNIPASYFDNGDKKLIIRVYRDGDDADDTLSDTAYLHAILVRGVTDRLGRNIS